jgi:CBS domain-containing protein
MGKTVRDAMTTEPSSVTRSTSSVDAARLMDREDVGSLPVVEQDELPGGLVSSRLVGIVTDRDIALRVVGAGLDPRTTQVGQILTDQPTTTYPDESLDEALELMAYHRVRRLPVTEDGRLIGMLAQADVVHEVRDKKAGQLVEEISQPVHN